VCACPPLAQPVEGGACPPHHPCHHVEVLGRSALNKFVNYLLFFRNRSPLHVAELNSYEDEGGDFDEAVQYLELWIRYSLSCPVAKLCVTSHDEALYRISFSFC